MRGILVLKVNQFKPVGVGLESGQLLPGRVAVAHHEHARWDQHQFHPKRVGQDGAGGPLLRGPAAWAPAGPTATRASKAPTNKPVVCRFIVASPDKSGRRRAEPPLIQRTPLRAAGVRPWRHDSGRGCRACAGPAHVHVPVGQSGPARPEPQVVVVPHLLSGERVAAPPRSVAAPTSVPIQPASHGGNAEPDRSWPGVIHGSAGFS